MQTFNKIRVICNDADVDIVDDGSDTKLSGNFSVEKGCLNVEIWSDSVLSIPPGQYEDIIISSTNGDCVVKLLNSTVSHISFDSECGDLTVEANCDDVSFNSYCGDYCKKGSLANISATNSRPKKTLIAKDRQL